MTTYQITIKVVDFRHIFSESRASLIFVREAGENRKNPRSVSRPGAWAEVLGSAAA